jgi:hypothetical protein
VTKIFAYRRHHVFKKFLDFRPSSEPSTEVKKALCMGLDHPDDELRHDVSTQKFKDLKELACHDHFDDARAQLQLRL